MLSPIELNHYHEHGYVIPDFCLSSKTLSDIKTTHSELVHQQPQFEDYCSALLPWAPKFFKFAQNPTILNMVSQILGDDFALWNASFFAKPAFKGSKTPWHQDGKYWPMRPIATCTVWIAVDDSNIENGCLQVVSGSHKDRRVRQHGENHADGLALNLELKADQFNTQDSVNLQLRAGQISIHDVYLIHGSESNKSAHARRGMTLRFMPTSSHYDRVIEQQLSRNSNFGAGRAPLPIFLMRGIDRCGKNTITPPY
jgi:ectoine hydroxylase-related dioxygenase (phytanoyl-CoA dioxygenase family)